MSTGHHLLAVRQSQQDIIVSGFVEERLMPGHIRDRSPLVAAVHGQDRIPVQQIRHTAVLAQTPHHRRNGHGEHQLHRDGLTRFQWLVERQVQMSVILRTEPRPQRHIASPSLMQAESSATFVQSSAWINPE